MLNRTHCPLLSCSHTSLIISVQGLLPMTAKTMNSCYLLTPVCFNVYNYVFWYKSKTYACSLCFPPALTCLNIQCSDTAACVGDACSKVFVTQQTSVRALSATTFISHYCFLLFTLFTFMFLRNLVVFVVFRLQMGLTLLKCHNKAQFSLLPISLHEYKNNFWHFIPWS